MRISNQLRLFERSRRRNPAASIFKDFRKSDGLIGVCQIPVCSLYEVDVAEMPVEYEAIYIFLDNKFINGHIRFTYWFGNLQTDNIQKIF